MRYLSSPAAWLFCLMFYADARAQAVKMVAVGEGWARNSVNAVVFRKNALVTHGNEQFIAYYDDQQYVVLGKRNLQDTTWELRRTRYRGNAADAHNCISIMIDGDGYLHMAWDHHNNPLHYASSVSPGSLELSDERPMTGKNERRVSYPEFFRLPDGRLLFLYRDGGSGQGNLVVNRYDPKTKQWSQLHDNLISGETQRNAYWQACVDAKGTMHLSWVWRESPDVASNHDLAYACSVDGGMVWRRSDRQPYAIPITASTAEYATRIPQRSELINQTSMASDPRGNPLIASYWRDTATGVPQYHLVFQKNGVWKTLPLAFRKTAFSLSGGGSKRIPIARPQVVVRGSGRKAGAMLIFRDEERGSKVSVAKIPRLNKGRFIVQDLTSVSVGAWEPTYDSELWKKTGRLHLFVQHVDQVDAEGLSAFPPQMIHVLEWKPRF